MSLDVSLEGVAALIVDDNADALELTAELLRLAGAQVSTAGSAQEALELLRCGAWDVVVTDISMPDGSGYDLIREGRQRDHRVPMIALTGLATEEHRRRVLASGFVFHLIKPVRPTQLIAAVAQTVSIRHDEGADPGTRETR